MTGAFWLVFLGYVLAVSTMSVPGRYAAMFLMAGGASGRSYCVFDLIPRYHAEI